MMIKAQNEDAGLTAKDHRLAVSAEGNNPTTKSNPVDSRGRRKNLINSRNRLRSLDSQCYFNTDTQSFRKVYDGYPKSFLTHAPTQDDIYQLLQGSESIPKVQSEDGKNLSPYITLPAIGKRLPPREEEVSTPKLTREKTYNVLEPRFVKGPSDSEREPDSSQEQEKKHPKKKLKRQRKKQAKSADAILQQSSATMMFGPKLSGNELEFDSQGELRNDVNVLGVRASLGERVKDELTVNWFN